MSYQELEKKTETNVCCRVCNKKCLVSLIETQVECHLNKSNEFVAQTEIILSDDGTHPSAVQETSSMSLDPRPKESPLNLNDRKQLIENVNRASRSVKLVRKRNIYLYLFEEVTVFTIFFDFSKSLGTRADGIYIINSRLRKNMELMKVMSLVNSIQVMLMIHANRL